MRKTTAILLVLLALGLGFFLIGTQVCKSRAKDAAGRIGFGFLEGCYLELSGDHVPLK